MGLLPYRTFQKFKPTLVINQLITTGHAERSARNFPDFTMEPPRKGSAHPSAMDPPTRILSRGGIRTVGWGA